MSSKGIQVIAVTSGKGGVGKTNTSINIAASLAKQGHKVMLMDADLGLANIDINLGLQCPFNMAHVMSGEKSLSEIIQTGPFGIQVVPAASGIYEMAALQNEQLQHLIQTFSEYNGELDYLIIDTAAGISDNVLAFLNAAHQVVVVVCDEPSSITDAYALIKVMSQRYDASRFHFIASMVKNEKEGQALYNKIERVVEHYLSATLLYLGSTPRDEQLRLANKQQKAVVEAAPMANSSRAYARMAAMVERWQPPTGLSGQMEFFVERLLQHKV
jgi:flagellar biosynthesis protein FlhG